MTNLWKNAQWIFADVKGEIKDRYFEYLETFEVEAGEETILYISVHSRYAVSINGRFVDCGQYDDYEDMKFYDRIPVSEYVKQGMNRIQIFQYVCGADFFTRRSQIPGVIFAIREKEKEICVSNPACLSREDLRFLGGEEYLTSQLGFNFEYDANVTLPEYTASIAVNKTKELNERPVKRLLIAKERKSRLAAQGVFMEWDKALPKAERCQRAFFSAMRRRELAGEGNENKAMDTEAAQSKGADAGTDCEKYGSEAKTEWELSPECECDGVYLIFDMGGESAGFLDFSITVPEKCEILISIGEHLQDLRVRSAVGARNFTFRYCAKGGKNEFFYPFLHFGLRYLQFLIYSRTGAVEHAGVREVTYPLTYREIPVSDSLHRMIWKTARRTLELCMHEHYEDCPWREQSQYGMDGRVQMLCGYYAFGEYEFPKAGLRLAAHSLREDRMLELCVPGKVPVNIPSFTAVFARQVLEYIQYSKDTGFAEEMYPVLLKIMENFEEKITEKGLIPQLPGQWNFYEWQDGIDGAGREGEEVYDSLLNAFVSDAFACFAEIAGMLKSPLADRYHALSEQINRKLHECFFRETYGGYATYLEEEKPAHDLTQAMLLYVGAVPEEWRGVTAETLKSGRLLPCSLSMSIYEYDALMQQSKDNLAYIIRKIEKIWGRMLCSESDTFWETALGAEDFDCAGSLCHGWSAVPIYIFGRYGSAAGRDFCHVSVNPAPGHAE